MTESNEEKYVEQSVTIDEENISGEYVRVSADLAYFVRRYADAEYEYLAAKAEVRKAEGVAYERAREELEADPEVKKATEKMVDARAVQSVGLSVALEELAKASSKRKVYDGYVDAIKTKRDMLISLGAHMRKEREAEPMIRDR